MSPEPRVTHAQTASPAGVAAAGQKAAMLQAVKDAQKAQHGGYYAIDNSEDFELTQLSRAEAEAVLRSREPTSLVQLSASGASLDIQAIVELIMPPAIGTGMKVAGPVKLLGNPD